MFPSWLINSADNIWIYIYTRVGPRTKVGPCQSTLYFFYNFIISLKSKGSGKSSTWRMSRNFKILLLKSDFPCTKRFAIFFQVCELHFMFNWDTAFFFPLTFSSSCYISTLSRWKMKLWYCADVFSVMSEIFLQHYEYFGYYIVHNLYSYFSIIYYVQFYVMCIIPMYNCTYTFMYTYTNLYICTIRSYKIISNTNNVSYYELY